MKLTEDQKQEVKHLCSTLGIGKLEAIARVLAKAEQPVAAAPKQKTAPKISSKKTQAEK